ncbi:MAG: hypothetical protein ABIH23_33765 [bacterium]
MNVDAVLQWVEETLPQLLAFLALLGVLIGLIVLFFRGVFSLRRQTGRDKMTRAQQNAEKAAIEKLNQAHNLLTESDQNVEEAQRLRDEAVLRDLAKHKISIAGKDPDSLLVHLDSQIRAARFRLHRQSEKEESESRSQESEFRR